MTVLLLRSKKKLLLLVKNYNGRPFVVFLHRNMSVPDGVLENFCIRLKKNLLSAAALFFSVAIIGPFHSNRSGEASSSFIQDQLFLVRPKKVPHYFASKKALS